MAGSFDHLIVGHMGAFVEQANSNNDGNNPLLEVRVVRVTWWSWCTVCRANPGQEYGMVP